MLPTHVENVSGTALRGSVAAVIDPVASKRVVAACACAWRTNHAGGVPILGTAQRTHLLSNQVGQIAWTTRVASDFPLHLF